MRDNRMFYIPPSPNCPFTCFCFNSPEISASIVSWNIIEFPNIYSVLATPFSFGNIHQNIIIVCIFAISIGQRIFDTHPLCITHTESPFVLSAAAACARLWRHPWPPCTDCSCAGFCTVRTARFLSTTSAAWTAEVYAGLCPFYISSILFISTSTAPSVMGAPHSGQNCGKSSGSSVSII